MKTILASILLSSIFFACGTTSSTTDTSYMDNGTVGTMGTNTNPGTLNSGTGTMGGGTGTTGTSPIGNSGTGGLGSGNATDVNPGSNAGTGSGNGVTGSASGGPSLSSGGTQPLGTQQFSGFSLWDSDRSSGLSSAEFNAGFMSDGLYKQWDTDMDGFISPAEYNVGVYNRWDSDASGGISTDEWANRNSVWDTLGGTNLQMNTWTNNSNKDMTRDQFNANFGAASNFKLWDLNNDGRLSQDEMSRGIYKAMDRNGDGIVDSIEFNGYYINHTGNTNPNAPGTTPR